MKKKKYIIVGDNNFWYATTPEITEKELDKEIKRVKTGIKENDFDDDDLGEPSQLYVFEAKQAKVINL